jgi:hypothetical protein
MTLDSGLRLRAQGARPQERVGVPQAEARLGRRRNRKWRPGQKLAGGARKSAPEKSGKLDRFLKKVFLCPMPLFIE